jgi:hypothetical protein
MCTGVKAASSAATRIDVGITTATNGTLACTVGAAINVHRAQLSYGFAQPHITTTTAAVFYPRIQHSATAPHTALGTLIEPQATQEWSCALGGQMPTQTVTVTATQKTASFYGAGTITLSGVHSATITGVDDDTLTTLTFTPSAGSLVATVTGTVTDAQLEAGAVATSRIPNPGTGSLVRSADGNWDIAGAQFTALWGAGSERTIIVEWWDTGAAPGWYSEIFVAANGPSYADSVSLIKWTNDGLELALHNGLTQTFSRRVGTVNRGTLSTPARNRAAVRIVNGGAVRVSVNGGATDGSGTSLFGTPDQLQIAGAPRGWGPAQHILTQLDAVFAPQTDAALQALSAL